jgi:hypothetical protein
MRDGSRPGSVATHPLESVALLHTSHKSMEIPTTLLKISGQHCLDWSSVMGCWSEGTFLVSKSTSAVAWETTITRQ